MAEEAEDVSDDKDDCGGGRQYLVHQSQLEKLLEHCPTCGVVVPVPDTPSRVSGTMVVYTIVYHAGHTTKRQSRHEIAGVPLGNLPMAAAILFTGLTFFSKSTFFSMQNRFLFPTISSAWESQQQAVAATLHKKKCLVLAGDCRCDCPGHNVKYGTDTTMEAGSDLERVGQ